MPSLISQPHAVSYYLADTHGIWNITFTVLHGGFSCALTLVVK